MFNPGWTYGPRLGDLLGSIAAVMPPSVWASVAPQIGCSRPVPGARREARRTGSPVAAGVAGKGCPGNGRPAGGGRARAPTQPRAGRRIGPASAPDRSIVTTGHLLWCAGRRD